MIHITKFTLSDGWLVGWLVVLMINVDLAIFQPYLDLEAGDSHRIEGILWPRQF